MENSSVTVLILSFSIFLQKLFSVLNPNPQYDFVLKMAEWPNCVMKKHKVKRLYCSLTIATNCISYLLTYT